jgi:hypothetical protein
VVRVYALRNWVEQSYKQVKHELGWVDCMVRTDRAIRRHWHLVHCAVSFCWRSWFADEPGKAMTGAGPPAAIDRLEPESEPATDQAAGRGEKAARDRIVAASVAAGTGLAHPLGIAPALLAGMVAGAPADRAASAVRRGGRRAAA